MGLEEVIPGYKSRARPVSVSTVSPPPARDASGGGGGGGSESTFSARNRGYGITGDKVTEALGNDPAKISAYCGTISDALANHMFKSTRDAQAVFEALETAYKKVENMAAAAPIELLEDGASEDESHLFSSSKK